MTDSLVFTAQEIKHLLVERHYPNEKFDDFTLTIKRYVKPDQGYILLTRKDNESIS